MIKYISTILITIIILTSCSGKKINGTDVTTGYEPFTSMYIKELRKNNDAQQGHVKIPWDYYCGDLDMLERFSADTLKLLQNYHKVSDSIVSENDVYDLLRETMLPDKIEKKRLIQQETYANIDLDYKTLAVYSKGYINQSDLLFLYSQMTNEPFYWREERMNNVKCLPTKELKEIYLNYQNIPNDSINWFLKRCCVTLKSRYGQGYCEVYSKPIFNREKTFAIMTIHSRFYGNIILFKKENNKWKLIERKISWIS